MSSLDEHREVVDRALREVGLGWDAWPDVAVTAPIDDGVQLSALLLLLAAPEGREADTGGGVVLLDHRADDAIDRVRRRRLPWDRDTARLAVTVVMQRGGFDGRRVAVALRGAEVVCSAGEVDAALLRALQACATWLDAVPAEAWRVPEMRLLVRRVIAAAAPPDLLDLSLLRDGDAWGVPARAIARGLPADEVAPLVRRLGELGSRKPSQAWLRSVEDALRPVAARDLLRRWLALAADTDVVAPDEVTAFSGGMLFAPGNQDVVGASVLATRLLPEESWVPEVLGVLARRGAATSGVPGMTASLALKVANAAVDTLATRGTPADRAVLEELLTDLSRRDLVKRVGGALGRPTQTAERDTELRRQKAAAVRRKADPAPRRARAAVDVLIRKHLGPVLRGHRFKGSGRTWRRLHADRVDVIGIGSGDGRIGLSYGTRFDAAHPQGEPFPVDRAKAFDYHLDIQLFEDWEASAPSLDRCAHHLASTVVPFLDTLGRYELARSYLEHDVGAPASTMRMEGRDSPASSAVLGMLALAAADRATAEHHLARRLANAQSWAKSADAIDEQAADAEVQFWRIQLENAQQLP